MLRKRPTQTHDEYNPLLFGHNKDEGLVAVEHCERSSQAGDEMILFVRRNGKTVQEREPFEPFILAEANSLANCPEKFHSRKLKGRGRLNVCASFSTWKDCLKAKSWLSKETGFSPGVPDAPYLFFNDPVQQHLITSGKTLFLGMEFGDLKRMQVDIECFTTHGYEFCNAQREDDRIIAIALGDQSGWVEVLSGAKMSEKALLEQFVEEVRERDPDVIEGHNIFNFDLPYITERARRHGVKLVLGRDRSVPRRRPSRFSVGERTISYERYELFGRHVVDTLFLVHAYDISHRSLDGFGLKDVAVHFGLTPPERTYIEGSHITEEFKRNPDKIMKYVHDDVVETRELGNLLSKSGFIQAQMLPYSYQNVCVRGTAAKIDAMMIREYLRQGYALPLPERVREFAGGYTDMFVQGIVENVHHCDVRSLYPSLMLTQKLAPKNDELGIFLKLLELLRTFRIQAKEKVQKSSSKAEKTYFDALQATFKVLINSFYGYLGFSQARFNDFDTAEKITAQGRSLIKAMISWLEKHGAIPVEIDTDGIYFVPPQRNEVVKGQKSEVRKKREGPKSQIAASQSKRPLAEGDVANRKSQIEGFRREFAASLPEGIEIEFDGEYKSMYSYKMKNYALMTWDGEMIIKGAALKSRGLEPFQRSFLRAVIRLKLEDKEEEIPGLKAEYKKAIEDRQWPIENLAKTESLQDAPATYAAKVSQRKRPRSAVYELALRSGRDYRAGDQLSYYVTGEKKSVAVHENSHLIADWDPKNRDENVPYYLAKLEALYKKFGKTEA